MTACDRPLSFHAVGDMGAARVKTGLAAEASVAEMMVKDVQKRPPTAPAFFFHLGDVVYNFGEGQYYLDQFYEPFRAYDRPIFAIAGNYVVSGSGGFGKTPLREGIPSAGMVTGDHTLEITPVIEFGYLTVTVDLTGQPPRLTIAFSSPNPALGANYDHVTVSLTEGKLLQHASSRAK